MKVWTVAAAASLAASALPAAPPASPTGAGSTLRFRDMQVASIVYRIALAGRALCPRLAPLTGIAFHHLPEYRPIDRPGMIARYGLDRGPGILAVVGGSPAERAGLQAGDVLLAENGRPFPKPPSPPADADSRGWRPATNAAEIQLEQALAAGPVDLLVLREGRELSIRLGSIPACPARVRVAYSRQVNAFDTGHGVVVTTAMIDFTTSNDELAIVLGHELAHRILDHPVMRNEDGLLAAFGIKAGTLWRREADADRLGLRLAASAGYDLAAAIPFWRRYLRKYDWYPQLFRSHPSLKARERIVGEEIDAIARESRPPASGE